MNVLNILLLGDFPYPSSNRLCVVAQEKFVMVGLKNSEFDFILFRLQKFRVFMLLTVNKK